MPAGSAGWLIWVELGWQWVAHLLGLGRCDAISATDRNRQTRQVYRQPVHSQNAIHEDELNAALRLLPTVPTFLVCPQVQ